MPVIRAEAVKHSIEANVLRRGAVTYSDLSFVRDVGVGNKLRNDHVMANIHIIEKQVPRVERWGIVKAVRLLPAYGRILDVACANGNCRWISLNCLGNARYVLVHRVGGIFAKVILLNIEIRVRILVGRAIVNIEHMLTDSKAGKAAECEAVVLGYAILLLRSWVIALQPIKSARCERSVAVFLRLANKYRLERQLPKPLDGRGMGVVAARDKSQTGILDIGNKTVAHEVPAGPEPDRREIILRPIEARRVVVDDRGQAVGLVGLLTENASIAVAMPVSVVLGGTG